MSLFHLIALLCCGSLAAAASPPSGLVFEGSGSGLEWVAGPDEPVSASIALERDGSEPRLRVRDADLRVDGQCSCESIAVRAPPAAAALGAAAQQQDSLCGAPGFAATWSGADLLSMLDAGTAQGFANRTLALVGDGTSLLVPPSGSAEGSRQISDLFWETSLGPVRRESFELTVDVDFEGATPDADLLVGVSHNGRIRAVLLADADNHPVVARPFTALHAGPTAITALESPYFDGDGSVAPGLRGSAPPYRVRMRSSSERFSARVRDGFRWESNVGSVEPLVLAAAPADPAAPTEELKVLLAASELHESFVIKSLRVQLTWACDSPLPVPHSLPEARYNRRWTGADLLAQIADGNVTKVGPRSTTLAADGVSMHIAPHVVLDYVNDIVLRIPIGFLPPRARVQFRTNLTRLASIAVDCDFIVGLANGVNTTYIIDHDVTNAVPVSGYVAPADLRIGDDLWNVTTSKGGHGFVALPTPEAYPLAFTLEVGPSFTRSVVYNRLGEAATLFLPEAALETSDRPIDIIIGLNGRTEELNLHWIEFAILPPLDLLQS